MPVRRNDKAVGADRRYNRKWRALVGVQLALIALLLGLWSWHDQFRPSVPPSQVINDGRTENSTVYDELLLIGDANEGGPYALPGALPDSFWEELDTALEEEIQQGMKDTESFFRQRTNAGGDGQSGSVALMDELLGLRAKFNATTLTDAEWDAEVKSAWNRYMYTDAEFRAHLALITERMSRRMSEVVTSAAEAVLDLIERRAPVYAASVSVEDISFEISEELSLRARRCSLEDLKVNLGAEAVSSLAGILIKTAVGALAGAAVGPAGAVVGGVVGFAVGLGIALAIELGDLGTRWERECVRAVEEEAAAHQQIAYGYISESGQELKQKYIAWMEAAVRQVVQGRI